MSLLTATQITAIATAVLAAGAIVTAVFAFLAFRKQSQEVRDQADLLQIQSGQLEAQREQLRDQQALSKQQTEVLELQARELSESLAERKRDAQERHRAQASRVYITEERFKGRRGSAPEDMLIIKSLPPSVMATVHNTSEQPIYEVELRWHHGSAGYGEPNPEPVGVIMPGSSAERERALPADAVIGTCGAVVRFTDGAGVRWRRRPDGDLAQDG